MGKWQVSYVLTYLKDAALKRPTISLAVLLVSELKTFTLRIGTPNSPKTAKWPK
jgi:hypothetical protein